eukprot:2483211-Pyramimonas_sp.AAC.1
MRLIERWVVRSMVRPINKEIDQEPGNPETQEPRRPPKLVRNQQPRIREPGNPGTRPPTGIGPAISPFLSISARTPL